MVPTLKSVDLRGINSALDALSRLTGQPLERVVDYEAGKILEAAIRFTPAASVSSIRSKVEDREFGYHDTGITPRRPELFRGKRSRTGKKLYDYRNRYPEATWAAISAQRKAELQRRLRARGLSKRSWLALAEAAGLRVNAPGYVRGALARTGKTYPENARITRRRSGRRYGIAFVNSQPTVAYVGGNRAIQRAINGRERFFRNNLRRGVFEDLQAVARRYPGLRVNPSA